VDDVEVHIVDSQATKTQLSFRDWVNTPRIELCREEDLVSRDSALFESTSDTLFISVRLCSVDVSVPEFERPAHRIDTLAPVGDLPYTKTQDGDAMAIGELPDVLSKRARFHVSTSLVTRGSPFGSTPAESFDCRDLERL
jgi:hypothetical protein